MEFSTTAPSEIAAGRLGGCTTIGRTAVGTRIDLGGDRAVMGGGYLPHGGRRVDDANSRRLLAHPSSVATARKVVRDVLSGARRDDLVETAQLLVSEVVTNALVHAGTPIDFCVSVGDAGLRVEVSDGSTQAPALRSYGAMAGTGRGLRLLQQLVDHWGTLAHPDGKTVWFELDSGDRLDEIASSPAPDAVDAGFTPAESGDGVVDVVLLNIPLLLHTAWQEHAEGLLREYLLVSLDADDPTWALETHAAASDAISLLHEHIPEPDLGEDPEELMALAVEPGVSCERQVLPVRRNLIDAARSEGVRHFVLVSVLGAGPDHVVPFVRAKGETEQALRESGLSCTILQPDAFMDVWFPFIVGPALEGGPVTLVGEGKQRQSMVAMQDVVGYAVAAVEQKEAANRVLMIGGEPVTWLDVVDTFSQVLGRDIPVQTVPPGEPVPGLPDFVAELLASLELYESPLDMSELSRTFGVKTTSLHDFARGFVGTEA